jgi:hypothetical protein
MIFARYHEKRMKKEVGQLERQNAPSSTPSIFWNALWFLQDRFRLVMWPLDTSKENACVYTVWTRVLMIFMQATLKGGGWDNFLPPQEALVLSLFFFCSCKLWNFWPFLLSPLWWFQPSIFFKKFDDGQTNTYLSLSLVCWKLTMEEWKNKDE